MIGDGKNTNVWLDHWLPENPPRRVVQVSYNQNMKVEDFIDKETFSWDLQKLEEFLQPQDIVQVLKIKLSRYPTEDKLVWPFTKDMEYTVKSGYWAATHHYHEGEEILRPDGSLEVKKKIWDLNILPKVKQFLWRVVSGALPTATRLCTRGINMDPTCQRCCLDDESINHVLFLCPHAYAIWRCSGMLVTQNFSNNLEDNIRNLFGVMESMGDHEINKLLVFWMLWLIWKSRNEFIFSKRNVHPIEDVRRAMDANIEWHRNVIQPGQQHRVIEVKSSKWEPPPSGWIKCNFDYSSGNNDKAGLGWILRDDKGCHLGSGYAQLERQQSSLVGEASSFLYALQQVWIRGLQRVWFEGDNKELCNIINQVKDHIEIGNLICDIRYWMMMLPESSLEFVNREKNQAADALARKATQQVISSVSFHIPPVWLIKYLYYPFTI